MRRDILANVQVVGLRESEVEDVNANADNSRVVEQEGGDQPKI